jgi:dTDP-4-dehydrorhamnose reductase
LIQKEYCILGSSGFLGSHFAAKLGDNAILHSNSAFPTQKFESSLNLNFHPTTLDSLDEVFSNYKFKTVINCVANADVDDCEKNPLQANFINGEVPKTLAQLSIRHKFKLIQISTDAVFNGEKSFRKEYESCEPSTVYGLSKLKGEQNVLETATNSIVARVNFVGHSERKPTLFDFIYKNLKAKREISGYTNIFFTPLIVDQTVSAILKLDQLNVNGIYHIAGENRLSKYDFAKLVCRIWDLDPVNLLPVEYVSNVPRPLDLSLDSTKIRELGISFPSILDSLKAYRLTKRSELL